MHNNFICNPPGHRAGFFVSGGQHACLHHRNRLLDARLSASHDRSRHCRRGLPPRDDWSNAIEDHETTGETYVSGIWIGPEAAYGASSVRVPPQFDETSRRKTDHFETLLGILKMLATPPADPSFDLNFWQARAKAAIAKAQAILAGTPDPS